jgi:hypothetical protein
MHAGNIGALNYIKPTLLNLKVQLDSQHNNNGYLNTPLLQINSPFRQNKINKEVSILIDTTDQMDLTDTYRVFHPGGILLSS